MMAFKSTTLLRFRSKLDLFNQLSISSTARKVQEKKPSTAKYEDTTEFKYLKEVNSHDAKLLLNKHNVFTSKTGKKTKHCVYKNLQDYRLSKDKKIVGNPSVAKEIFQLIKCHSEGTEHTPFIDADGGLCLVGRQCLNETEDGGKFSSKPVYIFDRNELFSVLHKHFFKDKDNVHVQLVNIFRSGKVERSIEDEKRINSLTLETAAFRNGWQTKEPGYTLYSTATLTFIKYLGFECFERWASDSRKLSEFYDIRPEFFFLVDRKTSDYLVQPFKIGKNMATYKSSNIHFRIFFDCEKIGTFPMESLLPWRTKQTSPKGEADLLKIRPKRDVGFQEGDQFEAYEFWYLIQLLVYPRGKKFIPLIEEYFPGIGLDIILNTGVTMDTDTKEINLEQIIPIFRIIISQKDFKMSNFAVSAYLTFIGKK